MRSLFRTNQSGGKVLFASRHVKTSTRGNGSQPTRGMHSGRKGFRRCYYRNGVLTIEHLRGTNRVFFSFQYQPDSYRVSRIRLMRRIAASTRQSDERRFPGVVWIRKRGSGKDLQESWDIRRLRVGRINEEQDRTWKDMDSQSFSSNDWEKVADPHDKEAIKAWIDGEMQHQSCVVVLIGGDTADSEWVNYEIRHAWEQRKGVLGVYIHNLVDGRGTQSPMGRNPFDYFSVGERRLSEIVRVYDPPFKESKEVYDHIRRSLDSWIEEAIKIRRANRRFRVCQELPR
jgi:hypothetical protein